jgi:hypothetical protein
MRVGRDRERGRDDEVHHFVLYSSYALVALNSLMNNAEQILNRSALPVRYISSFPSQSRRTQTTDLLPIVLLCTQAAVPCNILGYYGKRTLYPLLTSYLLEKYPLVLFTVLSQQLLYFFPVISRCLVGRLPLVSTQTTNKERKRERERKAAWRVFNPKGEARTMDKREEMKKEGMVMDKEMPGTTKDQLWTFKGEQ